MEEVKNTITDNDSVLAFSSIKYKKYFVSSVFSNNEIRIFENKEDWLNYLSKLDEKYNKLGRKYHYYKVEKIPEGVNLAKYIAVLASKYWEKNKVLRNGPHITSFHTRHFRDLSSLLEIVFIDKDKERFKKNLLYLLVPQKAVFYYRKEKDSEKIQLLKEVLYGELFRVEFVDIF